MLQFYILYLINYYFKKDDSTYTIHTNNTLVLKYHFSKKRANSSCFRNSINKLRSMIIKIIRIFFNNFQKKEIHHFLAEEHELDAYNSFVEVLSLGYNPEILDKSNSSI